MGRTIEELTRTVSASRLSTWLQCRLKFHLRYVAGISKPPTAALHVGKTVHAVLQQWSLARWRGAPLDSDAIDAVFEAACTHPEGQSVVWDGEEETASKTNALAVIQTYLRETPIPVDEKPEGVEVSVEIDLASHGLMLFDGDKVVPVGNVTIPPNHEVPGIGAAIECRYLYAHRGGSIFQPVYLGVRDDIRAEECQLSQLKYKADPAREEAA